MGTQSVRWAVKVGAELALTPTDRSILAYLAHCRNDRSGQCNPSRETIIAGTGWNDRTVRRSVKSLRASGVLDVADDESTYTLYVDSQSSALDSESGERGLTVQAVDSQSSALDSESNPSYIRKEHQLEHQENTPKPPSVEVVVLDLFDEFWEAWPVKKSKPAARRAWDKAQRERRKPAADIIAAAIAYRDNPHRPPAQFIPHPSTWLNNDRWNDPLDGPRDDGRINPDQRARQTITTLLGTADLPPLELTK